MYQSSGCRGYRRHQPLVRCVRSDVRTEAAGKANSAESHATAVEPALFFLSSASGYGGLGKRERPPPPQASGTSQTHRVQLASSGHGTVSFAIVQEKAAWWHYFGGSEHCIRSIREGQGGGLSDAKRGGGCLRRFPSPLTLLSRGNLQASLRYPHRHGRLCHGPLWLRRNSRYALTGLALWRRGPKTKKAKDRSTAATPHLQRAPEVCPGAHCECWYAGVWAV